MDVVLGAAGIWMQDLELPIDSGGADDDLPKFTLKAWDKDILGSSDQIGSCCHSLQPLFLAGWHKLVQQKGRDTEISKMTTSRVKAELQGANTALLLPKSAKKKKKKSSSVTRAAAVVTQQQPTESREQLIAKLREIDPVRQITSTR